MTVNVFYLYYDVTANNILETFHIVYLLLL